MHPGNSRSEKELAGGEPLPCLIVLTKAEAGVLYALAQDAVAALAARLLTVIVEPHEAAWACTRLAEARPILAHVNDLLTTPKNRMLGHVTPEGDLLFHGPLPGTPGREGSSD